MAELTGPKLAEAILKDKAKEVLPENTPSPITDIEVKEQLGHLTIQLLQASKTESHLRGIIKDLRKELDNAD